MVTLKIIMPESDAGENQLESKFSLSEYRDLSVWDLIYGELKKDALTGGETDESFQAQMPMFKTIFAPRGIENVELWFSQPISEWITDDKAHVEVVFEISPEGMALLFDDSQEG